MPKIENCSMQDFCLGNHRINSLNAVAIQITDPTDPVPTPAEDTFIARHVFEFFDGDEPSRFFPEEVLISDKQAASIANILFDALENDYDVLVHCVVGQCRSGAVVEVAEMIGFDECYRYRHPNVRVKKKLMEIFDLLPAKQKGSTDR